LYKPFILTIEDSVYPGDIEINASPRRRPARCLARRGDIFYDKP
jgi:hypothetical protein